MKNANELMDAYNDLSKTEQVKFKKRFLELLKFEKNINKLVKTFKS